MISSSTDTVQHHRLLSVHSLDILHLIPFFFDVLELMMPFRFLHFFVKFNETFGEGLRGVLNIPLPHLVRGRQLVLIVLENVLLLIT